MPYLVSLPMYDHIAIKEETDSWWSIIRKELSKRGVGAPANLTRADDTRSIWKDPSLLLTQCCGYDLMVNGYENLEPIVTPIYSFEDCVGGHYCSFIVVAKGKGTSDMPELKGKKLAINGYRSHSGYNALREFFAEALGEGPHGHEILVSGSHLNSLKAVASGAADAAAIDCVTFGMVSSYAPEITEELDILGKSPSHAVLPYAVQTNLDPEVKKLIRAALEQAFRDPDYAPVRESLSITDCVIKSREDYCSIKLAEERWRNAMPDFMKKSGN